MREIVTHRASGLNDALKISVADEPGEGGANHLYKIGVVPEMQKEGDRLAWEPIQIQFQNGPIGICGYNGVSNESLLAIVADRLESFQKGKFSCRENAIALTKIQEAMHWLHHRTHERMARGVEGTREK